MSHLLFACQNQDHYAVLGLSNLRYKATQKQIKAAREYPPVLLLLWLASVYVMFKTCSLLLLNRQSNCAEAPS